MKRSLLVLVVLAAAAMLSATALAGGRGSRGSLIFRNTDTNCALGALNMTDIAGAFVVTGIRNGRVSGTVSLDNTARNSPYVIELVQSVPGTGLFGYPCYYEYIGLIVTDSAGDGSLFFSVGLLPGAQTVWVSTFHHNHHLASASVPVGSIFR
jgi:hypothetical protein